ncbi:MAG: ATP-binding cassette domain-containing protein [Pseudomonadota bacterium]
MIEVTSLRKHFGSVEAVRDVSFSAPDGEITALLGPNGAGKSTTFRMLSTVIEADAGQALIDGVDVAADPLEVRRRLAVLPHDAGIYARLTARENVRYFGELHGLDRATIDTRLSGLIERLDMGEFCDRRTAGFSQGQRVKVALARALIHDPRNIILDEPTNGLDVMATRGLREIIRDLKAEGRCVLFSSHIMQEVTNLCDTLVVIDEGIVKFRGSLDAFRTQTGEDDLEEAFIALTTLGQS